MMKRLFGEHTASRAEEEDLIAITRAILKEVNQRINRKSSDDEEMRSLCGLWMRALRLVEEYSYYYDLRGKHGEIYLWTD